MANHLPQKRFFDTFGRCLNAHGSHPRHEEKAPPEPGVLSLSPQRRNHQVGALCWRYVSLFGADVDISCII